MTKAEETQYIIERLRVLREMEEEIARNKIMRPIGARQSTKKVLY